MATEAKPTREYRIDRGQLRAPRVTPEGFLEVEGYVARPGIYDYLNTPADEAKGYGRAGTVRRELKPREEVTSSKLISQFAASTVTAEHPPGKKVTASNRSVVDVGAAKAGRVDGDRPVVTLVIKDAEVIKRIKRGELNELSPGFDAMIYQTPGADRSYATPENPEGRYDLVQRDFEINHFALTDFARGGSTERIRVDSVNADYAELQGVALRNDAFDGKLTNAIDGHQHLVSFHSWDGTPCTSGDTSWATSEGETGQHSHAWVKTPEGIITIGESAGHTHTVLDERRYQVPAPPAILPATRADSREGAHMLDIKHMSPDEQVRFLIAKHDELVAANGALTTKVTSLEADLVTKAARVDALEQNERTIIERTDVLRKQLADGAVVAETKALQEMQTRVDSAELELAKLRDAQPTLVKKRAELIIKARTVIGPEFRTDSLENLAIQEHIVKKLRPAENLAGMTPAQVESRCDSLYADMERNTIELQRSIITGGGSFETRNDSHTGDPQPKPLSHRDQWKRGLPAS
jgi:hypothetical protein